MTITRVLVANRGEIARRVFRTARSMGLYTVAIHSDGDVNAPFVADADHAVALGGTTAAETYLDTTKVLDAAAKAGADAIHPGYGFLSENAEFAQAVIDAGITWIGPSPAAIASMGDKLAAKELMAGAEVPSLVSVAITDNMDMTAAGEQVGFPLLVKASAGGGGKGMRVVEAPADLTDAIEGARREAAGAFGDDTVFLERYLTNPRHVEIQVLGDTHGNLVHCFERECSIQRRHQKVIEESPSPVMTPALRERMGHAAIAAVQTIGYHSAGTVEFLLDGDGDNAEFFFLEVNTRLQVEHPVTEEVTGLDLVREQIRIADGEALGYSQDDLTISGHAIEARLYAEDPANGFLPATGALDVWAPATTPPARYDSGIEQGSVVGVEFDPMLAKVIVHAPTRREAALRLALALERTHVHGVVTNRDFLVSVLRAHEFLAGDTTTDFIDRVGLPGQRQPAHGELEVAAAAVALCSQARNRAAATALDFMPSGYRNSSMPDEALLLEHQETDLTVLYRRLREGSYRMTIGNGEPVCAELLSIDGNTVAASVDGVRSAWTITPGDRCWHVDGPAGSLTLNERSRFPELGLEAVAGGLVAPMPGKVLAIDATIGDQVTKGQVLVLMEAMKMEHQITAPADGEVTEILIQVGEQVDNGSLLAVIATDT